MKEINKKAIEKVKKKVKGNPYCSIKLQVHDGEIRTIETLVKEKLE